MRTGGAGGGAADQGRDLEAHFYGATADGEMEPQNWWIECKGRSGTVEPEAVKAAVNNALAMPQLDYLVIATNTQFSNPTRDWVRTWQNSHPRPKVKLWDSAQLERYLSRHPAVVLRLFAGALSLQGRFHAMSSRFWNKLEYSTPGTLIEIWQKRTEIKFTELGLFAAIANEFANGNIAARPWAVAIERTTLVDVISLGFTNIGYLVVRSSTVGADNTPIYRTFAYLLLAAAEAFEPEALAELVLSSIGRGDKDSMPEDVREYLLMPIMDRLLSEIQEICVSDCQRIIRLGRDSVLTEERDSVEDYWLRLGPVPVSTPKEEPKEYFQIERYDSPCTVGFTVNKETSCPLFAAEPKASNVADVLAVIRRVAAFRKAQALAKRSSKTASYS